MTEDDFDPLNMIFSRLKMQDAGSTDITTRTKMKPAHHEVISHLERGKWVNQSTIAQDSDLTKRKVRKRLNELVELDRVARRKDPNDKRNYQYQLK